MGYCIGCSVALAASFLRTLPKVMTLRTFSIVYTTVTTSTSWFKLITRNRQPRMPHATVTRMSHIYFGVILTAMNSGRAGGIASFYVKDLLSKTRASAENVSRPITGLQRGQ